MSDKKHIDRLYQERFKDFEATPPPAAWDAIEQRLQAASPRSRSVIPFWLWYAGVAAAIIALLTLGNLLPDQKNDPKQPQTTPISAKPVADSEKNSGEATAPNETSIDATKATPDVLVYKPAAQRPATSASSPAASGTKPTTTSRNQTAKSAQHSTMANNKAVTNNTPSNRSHDTTAPLKDAQALANAQDATQQGPFKEPVNNHDINSSQDTNTALVKNNETPPSLFPDASNAAMNTQDPKTAPENSSVSPQQGLAISQQQPATGLTSVLAPQIIPPDSLPSKRLDLNEIAKTQQLEEETQEATSFHKSWSGTPVFAPRYTHTLGGSSVGEHLKDNVKVGGVHLSYGMLVGYNFAPKLAVRTGLHQVSMSFTTQNITYALSTQSLLNEPLTFAPQAIFDAGSNGPGNAFPQEFVAGSNSFSGITGDLSQRLEFVEIPLELSYRILDRKLSLYVSGGMSTYFLTSNNVAVIDGSKRLELGEDSNFNNVHQSANLGLGLGYKFTDRLSAMVEPLFKYQWNTLKRDVADFRPYNIGLYTGISYTF